MADLLTERLILRPFTAADLPAFASYRSDAGVARHQSWDTSFSMADAEAFLAEQQAVTFGQRGAWVQIAAADRATGELWGDCAVKVLSDQPGTADARDEHLRPSGSGEIASLRGLSDRCR